MQSPTTITFYLQEKEVDHHHHLLLKGKLQPTKGEDQILDQTLDQILQSVQHIGVEDFKET